MPERPNGVDSRSTGLVPTRVRISFPSFFLIWTIDAVFCILLSIAFIEICVSLLQTGLLAVWLMRTSFSHTTKHNLYKAVTFLFMKIARVKAFLGLDSAFSLLKVKMEQETAKHQEVEAEERNFQYLIRIANTDLDGKKKTAYALRKIKGIGMLFAHMACSLLDINPLKKAGNLTKEEVQKLSEFIKDPKRYGAPSWALNRQNDPETGGDFHLISGDLNFTKDNDLKRLKKIKSYRGSRHTKGLPCRGQRTKSNFRKSKSKGKGGLGVVRKKLSKKGGK